MPFGTVPFSRSRSEAPARVLAAYRHMLDVRTAQAAFHPDADQETIDLGRPELVAFLRMAPGEKGTVPFSEQKILVVANVGSESQTVDLSDKMGSTDFESATDLLDESTVVECGRLDLKPYQVAWLLA